MRESAERFVVACTDAIADGGRRRGLEWDGLKQSDTASGPWGRLEDWLSERTSDLPRGNRVLLCLDEYPSLTKTLDEGWGADLLDELRALNQQHAWFGLMLVGSYRLGEVSPEFPDRFINARTISIDHLKVEEAEHLITKPIPEFDAEYADGAVERIIAQTDCQPFLVQAVCFELVHALNRAKKRHADLADVDEALRAALRAAEGYLSDLHNEIDEAMPLIEALLREGALSVADLGAGADFPEHEVQAEMERLQRQDVTAETDEVWRIRIPLVETYLREQLRIE